MRLWITSLRSHETRFVISVTIIVETCYHVNKFIRCWVQAVRLPPRTNRIISVRSNACEHVVKCVKDVFRLDIILEFLVKLKLLMKTMVPKKV